MRRIFVAFVAFTLLLPSISFASIATVKDVARIQGMRDTALVGYGLVSGLAGTGDSSHFVSTSQSLRSLLRSFDVNVDDADVRSRNVAAVMITANIPSFAEPGDKIDIRVSAIGDARSLAGGTLLLSPLKAPNGTSYALAQGQITVGGYRFEQDQNVVAKNHVTVGTITRGATVERSIEGSLFDDDGAINIVLNAPDISLMENIASALEQQFPRFKVARKHAGKIKVSGSGLSLRDLAQIEQLKVHTTEFARIVVNERSGVIVSGADIPVSRVVISHGAISLKIRSIPRVSQPNNFLIESQSNAETVVIRETEIDVDEGQQAVYINKDETTIAEVVSSLRKLNIPTRDIISILEGLKQSGALYADIIVQ
ncbi:flagellar basal body P-ring protein FlgI [Aestuariibacter sp. AA17]|uniref:Flagellar P-ring protein n=1 Tax=Fluctibacter corallii TaxID=2984329 RepID=A0ABT3A9J8_9ALTE|nr:flagellar basal body P-ring protein FlgI [Aestuariibacter sp. AA17]MCV2885319.1 flagellar basal body P-ring protein FlgI [Aestuariibacter sp. AA17]